ncbi:MAG TPA: helix-turn-helix transcriptional regulator [Ramlibacter sp.]|uniref:helix-turn-helix domain-containing protein n=1 Tax=Ramlibacter sp. TaxID=1917967 RepID=UPI002D07C4A8|nr:helix-turn-helix transcriptional regulator [Ramlibacter sp.]HVZ46673.1 helix-turn-helix transcriptional regulator [Ramlibacter sp.]
MPNIATVLKSEIARLARKEVRSETDTLKKSSVQYRADIAALKRTVKELERRLKLLSKANGRASVRADDAEPERRLRFSPSRLAAQRKRLGLSAADFGALVGVTGQSIYKWEQGSARPRTAQLQAIAQVRSLGKREANARLEQLQRR